MSLIHVVVILQSALLWPSLASVITSMGGGLTYCDGMICPADSGCSITSNVVRGAQVTQKTCTDNQGHIVKQETTEGLQNDQVFSSRIFNVGSAMCVINERIIQGKLNVTKLCRDETGNLRPMTPEEEQYFAKMMAEAEEQTRLSIERGRQQYQRAMKHAAEQMKRVYEQMQRMGEQFKQQRHNFEENMKQWNTHMRGRLPVHVLGEHERRLEEEEERREREMEQRELEHERAMEQLERELDAVNDVDYSW